MNEKKETPPKSERTTLEQKKEVIHEITRNSTKQKPRLVCVCLRVVSCNFVDHVFPSVPIM